MKLHQTERHGEVMSTAIDPEHGSQNHTLCQQFHAGRFSHTSLDSVQSVNKRYLQSTSF